MTSDNSIERIEGRRITAGPLYFHVTAEMVDDIVDCALGLTVFVSKNRHTIDSLVTMLLHRAEFFIDLQRIYVVHADFVVLQVLKKTLVGFNKFVAVHIIRSYLSFQSYQLGL